MIWLLMNSNVFLSRYTFNNSMIRMLNIVVTQELLLKRTANEVSKIIVIIAGISPDKKLKYNFRGLIVEAGFMI